MGATLIASPKSNLRTGAFLRYNLCMKERIPGGPQTGRDERINPDIGSKKQKDARKKTRGISGTVAAVGMSAVLAGDTITPDLPHQSPISHETSVQAPSVAKPEAPAENKIEKIRTDLRNAIARLNDTSALQSTVPIFKKDLNPLTTCGFVDGWYKQNKPYLNEVWKYMDTKSDHWNDDLDTALKEALEISKTAAEAINWWFVPQRFWAPTTEIELRGKIGEYLPKPATQKTSCGKLFDTGFNYLKEKGKADELQRVIILLFRGSARLLIAETEGKNHTEVQEELRIAEKYLKAFGAMIPEKSKEQE